MNDTYRSFAKLSLTSRGDGNSSYTAFADEFRFRRGGSSTDWIQASWDTSVVGSTFLSNGGVASTDGTKICGIEAAPSWTQASVTGTFSVQIGSDPFPATLTVDGVTRTGFADDADIPIWEKPYVSTALMAGSARGFILTNHCLLIMGSMVEWQR